MKKTKMLLMSLCIAAIGCLGFGSMPVSADITCGSGIQSGDLLVTSPNSEYPAWKFTSNEPAAKIMCDAVSRTDFKGQTVSVKTVRSEKYSDEVMGEGFVINVEGVLPSDATFSRTLYFAKYSYEYQYQTKVGHRLYGVSSYVNGQLDSGYFIEQPIESGVIDSEYTLPYLTKYDPDVNRKLANIYNYSM